MFRHLWLVVGLGAAAFPHMAIADMYTFNCLIGYENDRHDKLCAVVAPELGGAVVEAQRKWRERNRESLVALKAACGVRLRKAYGDDTARLNRDRERVIALRNEDDLALFNDPDRRNKVDCRGYVKNFSVGGRVDIDQDLIEQTRESPIEKFELPEGR